MINNKGLIRSSDVIPPWTGNHHWKSHWLYSIIKHSYTLTVESQLTSSLVSNFLKALHTSLGTWSKAFSKSKKMQSANSSFMPNISPITNQSKNSIWHSTSLHETNLYLINVPLLSYQLLNNYLIYLISVPCFLSFQYIPFSLVKVYNSDKFPFCWNNSLYCNLID